MTEETALPADDQNADDQPADELEGAQPDADRALRDDVEAALKVVRARQRELKSARSALEGLRGGGVRDLRALREARAGLDGFRLGDEELDAGLERIGADVERRATRLTMTTRMDFLEALEAAADAADVGFRKLGDHPLTVLLSPLTLECDVEAEQVTALFGREVVEAELPLRAERLVARRGELIERMKEEAVESRRFFDRLRAAYELVRRAEGKEPGERVDIVDLLVPLAVLSSERKEWRRKGIDALTQFPRYLLAYQLFGLRRDALLEIEGTRLDLGTATGGSTRDKRDVLFVPTSATDGQYYGSLRFVT